MKKILKGKLGKMQLNLSNSFLNKNIILFLACSLFALWNIPHTISIRYTIAVILFLSLITHKQNLSQFLKNNVATFLIFLYLIFNLLSNTSDTERAFGFYRHIWLNSILFMILGYLVGEYIKFFNSKQILFYFGVAFSIPIYIHLTVFFWKWITLGSFPIGYPGISITHGDMAYASIPALIFLYCYKEVLTQRKYEIYVYLLIGILPMSLLFTASRGGLIFFIITYLLLYLFGSYRTRNILNLNRISFFALILALSAGIFFIGNKYQHERWSSVITKAKIGFLLENPVELICKKLKPIDALPVGVMNPFGSEESLNSNVADGDLARVLVLRAGITMLEKNFWGVDGSKESYVKAIKRNCPNVGDIVNSAHNGWVNMALAIGLPGAILYLLFFIYYFWRGLKVNSLSEDSRVFKLALIVMSLIWPLRALLDATMQDQMLQMQSFLLPLIWTILLAKTRVDVSLTKTSY